jgi:hypothetical protein
VYCIEYFELGKHITSCSKIKHQIMPVTDKFGDRNTRQASDNIWQTNNISVKGAQ